MTLSKPGAINPSYKKRLGYQGGILGGIGILIGTILVIINLSTHKAIEHAKALEQELLLKQVIPETYHDNNLLESIITKDYDNATYQVFVAKKQEAITAYAYEVSKSGYSGEIKILIGIDNQGVILGVRTLSHTETPGLGDKIELAKDDWVLDFNGKSLGNPPEAAWKVKKDGGVFDQFTGATITPRAYVAALKQGLLFFENTLKPKEKNHD